MDTADILRYTEQYSINWKIKIQLNIKYLKCNELKGMSIEGAIVMQKSTLMKGDLILTSICFHIIWSWERLNQRWRNPDADESHFYLNTSKNWLIMAKPPARFDLSQSFVITSKSYNSYTASIYSYMGLCWVWLPY